MDKGAKGCEVVVSGKLRGQRAKAMKFTDGYMIHAGDATNYYVEKAVKHVHLRQGVIGIKVKIMLPHDPTGDDGVSRDLPDAITVHDPDKAEVFDSNQQQQSGAPMVEPAYMSNAPQEDIRNLDNNGAPPQQMDDDNDNNNDQDNDSNMMQEPQQMNNDMQQPPPQNVSYGNDPNQGGFNQY